MSQNWSKISAQPHTIVKQIWFPNGNALFLSLFSLSKNWMYDVVWGYAEILPYSLSFTEPEVINCLSIVSRGEYQELQNDERNNGNRSRDLYKIKTNSYVKSYVHDSLRIQPPFFASYVHDKGKEKDDYF